MTRYHALPGWQYTQSALPNELIHEEIIPLLFSEHLHVQLVLGKTSKWNPFSVLPLVCREFYRSCQHINRKIFALKDKETIADVMDTAGALWTDANSGCISTQIPELTSDPDGPSLPSLCGRRSLIDIYFALAQAQIFFKLDIMAPIVKAEQWRNESSEIRDYLEDFETPYTLEVGYRTKAFIMKDNVLHRFMRSLTAALSMCDNVYPESLVQPVAKYLAKITPRYVTMAFMLQEAQSLEHLLIQKGSKGLWKDKGEWIQTCLDHLDSIEQIVDAMYAESSVVRAYGQAKFSVPAESIETTDIREILNQVFLAHLSPELSETALIVREEYDAIVDEWYRRIDGTVQFPPPSSEK